MLAVLAVVAVAFLTKFLLHLNLEHPKVIPLPHQSAVDLPLRQIVPMDQLAQTGTILLLLLVQVDKFLPLIEVVVGHLVEIIQVRLQEAVAVLVFLVVVV